MLGWIWLPMPMVPVTWEVEVRRIIIPSLDKVRSKPYL
jgi:hypothetical protein